MSMLPYLFNFGNVYTMIVVYTFQRVQAPIPDAVSRDGPSTSRK